MRNSILRVLSLLVVLSTVFIVTGCAPTLLQVYQRIETIPPNKAIVYIYRPSAFIGGGVYYDVKANSKVVTTLWNGGYYPYIADPGEIEFSAKTESTDSVTLDVKTGQAYYVKGTVGVGFLLGRPHLTVVSANIAEAEITECKLIPEPEKEGVKADVSK